MSTLFYTQSPDGVVSGPFSHEELLASVMQGELNGDDLVRTQDSTFWVGARHIKGLFRDLPVETLTVDSNDSRRAAYEAELAAIRDGVYERTETKRRLPRRVGWWRDEVGWEVFVAAALVLVGVTYSVLGTPESLRFPRPERMGGPASQGYFFFGTGPWSSFEYGLLWLDSWLVIGLLAFGRRIYSSKSE